MRLSWNEVRHRARKFVRDWKGAKNESAETQLFYNDFFNVFGISVKRVATFEKKIKISGDRVRYADLLWKNVLLVEQKSAGGDLIKAMNQAKQYLTGIEDSELPKFILVCDFQNFELTDLVKGETLKFKLSELPKQIERFGFMIDVEHRSFKELDQVSVDASREVGKLHDALKAGGYGGTALEWFLVRLVFCFFADSTGIFSPRGIFLKFIENRTSIDGSDLGHSLSELFQILNRPVELRQKFLDEDLQQFPHVKGELFQETLEIPAMNSSMRKQLIEACEFDWEGVSPAIFGSMFQFVMNKDERREKGAHYTSEQNILKVIEPLFLSDLRAEFEKIKSRKHRGKSALLKKFHDKLSNFKFFGPACGCGNFLVIAYRELRELELEVISEIRNSQKLQGLRVLDSSALSLINVDQFYGIEISEFPVRIAEAALWMMDHIMNNKLSDKFGLSYVRIPLVDSPNIVFGDALEIDWSEVLLPEECSFILGNPPFMGAKLLATDGTKQRQIQQILEPYNKKNTLDYVTAWFIKAAEYSGTNPIAIGFVATNSITQGEQVSLLWPILLDHHGFEIMFAHKSFPWDSEAPGKAAVEVVIVGLKKNIDASTKRLLYSYSSKGTDPVESAAKVISPYLFDSSSLPNPNITVKRTKNQISGLPIMTIGSKPVDGGHFIFTDTEKREFLKAEPAAKKFMRPYIGNQEFVNNQPRWILALQNSKSSELSKLPMVRE